MPSDFDADFAYADALLAEAFGVEVTIRRGTKTTEEVTAEVVTRNAMTEAVEEYRTNMKFRDYIISVADYQIESAAVDPRVGDQIEETINGTACTFEIMPAGDRPPFEWADTDGKKWIIRTKKVA